MTRKMRLFTAVFRSRPMRRRIANDEQRKNESEEVLLPAGRSVPNAPDPRRIPRHHEAFLEAA